MGDYVPWDRREREDCSRRGGAGGRDTHVAAAASACAAGR
jgi:hypothetical protein